MRTQSPALDEIVYDADADAVTVLVTELQLDDGVTTTPIVADLAALDARVTTNETAVDGLDAYATDGELGLVSDAVDAIADDYATGTALDALDARVTTNEAAVAGLDAYATDGELGLVSDAVDAIADDYATGTALGALDARVTTNEAAVAGLDAYATAADVSDLDVRVAANEVAVSGLDADVGDLDGRVCTFSGVLVSGSGSEKHSGGKSKKRHWGRSMPSNTGPSSKSHGTPSGLERPDGRTQPQ